MSCPHPPPQSFWNYRGFTLTTHTSVGEKDKSSTGTNIAHPNVYLTHLLFCIRTIQATEPTEITSESATEISPGLQPPSEYQDLVVAFSKVRVSQLLPHHPHDCAIDLIPGTSPPNGRIFPLSQPEILDPHQRG